MFPVYLIFLLLNVDVEWDKHAERCSLSVFNWEQKYSQYVDKPCKVKRFTWCTKVDISRYNVIFTLCYQSVSRYGKIDDENVWLLDMGENSCGHGNIGWEILSSQVHRKIRTDCKICVTNHCCDSVKMWKILMIVNQAQLTNP